MPPGPSRPRPGLGKTGPNTPGTGRKGVARVTKRGRRKLDRDTIRGISKFFPPGPSFTHVQVLYSTSISSS